MFTACLDSMALCAPLYEKLENRKMHSESLFHSATFVFYRVTLSVRYLLSFLRITGGNTHFDLIMCGLKKEKKPFATFAPKSPGPSRNFIFIISIRVQIKILIKILIMVSKIMQ